MTHVLEDLHDFIMHSPTSYHAAVEIGNRLASLDYTPLHLEESWKLEKGHKYFVHHEGSILAFSLPKNTPEKLAIIATHTDSPALKLKPRPEIQKKNMLFLGVEVYGGPILPTWMNRELAIAGRVSLDRGNNQIEEHLVYFDDAPLLIPLIAPHLERESYKKGMVIDKQEHLVPLATLRDESTETSYIEELIKREISFHKLLGFDLFLVPLEHPRFIGMHSEMLSSYRIDNLSSAHAALVALGHLDTPNEQLLPMGLFWDHEEVGSHSTTGADSPLFVDVLRRITAFYKLDVEQESILRSKSLCLSVDLTHAYNPNFKKKYDPMHLPLLGEGIVIKFNANMRYCSSSAGKAHLTLQCEQLGLKLQEFVNRTDNPPGSTVGPVFATQTGIETIDIGIAQLSMHATREVISCQDQIDMTTLLSHFVQEEAAEK